jgi:hypothetical protein
LSQSPPPPKGGLTYLNDFAQSRPSTGSKQFSKPDECSGVPKPPETAGTNIARPFSGQDLQLQPTGPLTGKSSSNKFCTLALIERIGQASSAKAHILWPIAVFVQGETERARVGVSDSPTT